MLESWFEGGVTSHLALLVSHNSYCSLIREERVNDESRKIPNWLHERIEEMKLPNQDSLLVRIRDKLVSGNY
jgi:hypothetical protein